MTFGSLASKIVHHALLKIGRVEYFEALDFLGYLRMAVLGPLLHIKKWQAASRREKGRDRAPPDALELLKETIATYDKASILPGLSKSRFLLQRSQRQPFCQKCDFATEDGEKAMQYFDEIEKKSIDQLIRRSAHSNKYIRIAFIQT